MMKPLPLILIFIVLLALVPVCNAETEYVEAGRYITLAGVQNITVSLGLENVVPIAQARVYYNWISVGLLTMIAASASTRTTRFFAILLPAFAGLLLWFGWLSAANPAHPEQLWGIVVVCVVIGVAVYMKDALHESFGIAGPGSLFFNLVFYILILETVVGFVNYTQIWDINAAPTESDQYTEFALSDEVTNINSQGGLLADIANAGSVLTSMAIGCVKMFISMGVAICAFSVTLGIIFPWIPESAYGTALLGVLQLGIYIIYFMAYMRFTTKTAAEGDF